MALDLRLDERLAASGSLVQRPAVHPCVKTVVMVDIRVGPAIDSLRDLIRAGGDPFDLIFIDADKASYPKYLNCALQLSRSGSLILADNVIRHGKVLEADPPDANNYGAKAYNEAIARHPGLESLVLPIIRHRIDGMAISIVR